MHVALSKSELISLMGNAEGSAFRKWYRTCHIWPYLGVLACDFARRRRRRSLVNVHDVLLPHPFRFFLLFLLSFMLYLPFDGPLVRI